MTSPSDLLVKNLLDEKDQLDELRTASVPPVRGYAQGRAVPFTSDSVTPSFGTNLAPTQEGIINLPLRELTLDEQLKRAAEAKGESHYFNPEEKSWKLVTPPKEQPLTRMPFTQPEKAIPSAELPKPREGAGFILDILSGRKTTENPKGLSFVEYSRQFPAAEAAIVGIPAAVTVGAIGYQGIKEATNAMLYGSLMRNLSLQAKARNIPLSKEEAQLFANEFTNVLARRFSMAQNWKNAFNFARGKYVPKPEVVQETESVAQKAAEQYITMLIPRATQTGAMAMGGTPKATPGGQLPERIPPIVPEMGKIIPTEGTLRPFGMADEEMKALFSGRKPIVDLANKYIGRLPKNIVEEKTGWGYLYYPKGDKSLATQLKTLMGLPSEQKFTPEWHTKVGRVFGYSEEDIKAFLASQSQGTPNFDAQTGKIIPKPAEIVAPEPTTIAQEVTPAPEVTTPVTVYGFGATAYEQKATVNMIQLKDQEWVTWIDPDGNRITGKVMGEAHIERAGGEGKQQGYTIAEGNPSPGVEVRDLGVITDRRLSLKYPNSNKAIVIPTAEVTMPPSTSVQTGQVTEPIPQAPETAVTAVEPTSAIDMPQERISPPLGQPPDDVPPSNPTEVALVEGVPSEWEGIMPNLRSADEIAKIMFREDDWRVFANLPMMRQIMSHFNPAAIADNPSLKYKVIRAVLRFESTQRSAAVLSHLEKLGNQEKIFGKLDDKGFIASGKLKGLSVNDIRTYPKKYVNKLTEAQKWWINNADEIEKAKLDFLRRNDININELSFEEGGQYAGRRWLFKRTSDGTIVESGTIGTGGARPGKKLGVEKHRVFSSQKEGIEVGFYPMPEDAAIALNVKGAFQRVADKEAAEWLLSKVDWRTTKAPDDLILAAESAKSNLQKSKQLLAALNRAVRGERVPDSTINSIANVHPAEAKRLSNLIPRLQKGEETANEVKSLTAKAKELIKQSQQEYWKATAARARAREIAMQVGYDEGAVSAPAFAGKIFTGPEAKEITRAINKDLQSTAPSILRAVNKVNAISRYFMLAGDFSPLFIQLLYLAGGNPAVYGKAAIGALRGLMSPQFLTNYYANNRDLLNANPDLILSRGGSTEFTEAMQKGGLLSSKLRLIPQEENFLKQVGLFAPRLLGKTGATLLEPFQRFFETALDVAGIEMRKGLDFLAKDPKSIEEVNMFINEFRGLASSERIGVSPAWREGETATLLAPRYNRAIASLLFDLGRNNIRGKLAREYLAMGITAVVAMAIVISLARREDPLKHLDPRSTEFLTWNIAGQQVGPGSKVRSVIRLMGQWTKAIQDGNEEDLFAFSMDNPSIRFLRGNLSPAVGTAIDLITGRNFIGDPTRDSMMHFTKEVLIGNLTPIWVENALMEGGTTLERGVRGLVEFLGGRAYPETTWDKVKPLREKYAKEDFGTDYESLNSAQIDELKRNHSDLAKLEEGASKEWAEKGTDFERWYFDETERVVKQRNENLELAAQALLDGKISKYEYDNQRGYIRPYYSGGRAVLWSAKEALDAKAVERINRWMDENLSPEDKYMNQYREYESELIEKSDLPIDWNTIEKDTFNWLAQLPTKYRDYILEHKDDWIKDLPEAARQIEAERLTGIDNGRWWDGYRESGVGGGLPSIGGYSQNRQTPSSGTLPPVRGYSQNRGQ